MEQTDRILVDEESFKKAINELKGHRMILVDARSNLISQTDDLAENWRAKSGQSFNTCANLIEASFKDLLDKLEEEIKSIEEIKSEVFEMENNMSKKIKEEN